jgi:transcriptional regulator with XRE-family HTH domain
MISCNHGEYVIELLQGGMFMSYAIGLKIKELRCNHNISQEKMAEALGTTRQRYSRLENGQVDISYIEIKKIADFFGIPTKEITSSQEEKKELVTLFRERTDSTEAIKFVAKIEEILKVFHAHEKLYYQMKVCDDADD